MEKDCRYYYSCYGSDEDDYPHLFRIMEKIAPMKAGTELAIFTEKSARPSHIRNLLEMKDRLMKYPVIFHGPFAELEATSEPGSSEAEYMKESYRRSFDICREFHAPSIVMHTNQRTYADGEKDHLQRNAILMIRALGETALRKNVELTVENVGFRYNHSMLFSEDEFIDLFNEIPENVQCLIDIGHAFLNGWDMEKVIGKLSGRIRSYHIHNNDGIRDIHRPLFEKNMIYSERERRIF